MLNNISDPQIGMRVDGGDSGFNEITRADAEFRLR